MVRGGERHTSMAQVMDASTNAPMNIPRAPCTSTCEKYHFCACKQLIKSGYEDVISWLPSASQKTLNAHTDTHKRIHKHTRACTHTSIAPFSPSPSLAYLKPYPKEK